MRPGRALRRGNRDRVEGDRLGATSAPALLPLALGSCAIATGASTASPCPASPLPSPYQPLHFHCSSADLPLVIMPEPK